MFNPVIYTCGRLPNPRKVVPPLFEPMDKYAARLFLDAYTCSSCNNAGFTSGRMWTATECAACHERKEKEKCGLSSSKTTGITVGQPSQSTGSGTGSNVSKTASPQASDPESAGYQKDQSGRFTKDGKCIWKSFSDRKWRFFTMFGTSGGYDDFRTIDAMLFPARELRTGDLVECLDLPEKAHCEKAAFVGKQFRIVETRLPFGCWDYPPNACVTLDSPRGQFWPKSALRLVKAVEEK